MPRHPGSHRMPATSARAARFGLANQISHEAAESLERKRGLARMEAQKAKRKARGADMAAKKKKETGANAGTMGGSRSGLLRAFMGR